MGRRNNFNAIFWGLALVLVGVLFLAQNLGYLGNFPFWNYLPAILIVLGLYQLFANQFRAWAGPLNINSTWHFFVTGYPGLYFLVNFWHPDLANHIDFGRVIHYFPTRSQC